MSTKASGAGMYAGLLETSREVAKAREAGMQTEATGMGKAGMAIGQNLMAIANKEQKRLDQLDKDQSTAAEWLGEMADTSGLLGDFENPITQFALLTKNTLNDIAKDESLSQYEKSAKYKEAVDAFNKRVSKYSGDQEIISGLTGRFAKGEIGGGVEQTSNEYQIGKAFAHGKWELQGDTYIIKGEDGKPIQLTGEDGEVLKIDSSYLKNMHLPNRQYVAGETMGKLATAGLNTKSKAEAEAYAAGNMWSTCYDKSSCSTWLTENNFKNQSEVRAEFYNEGTGEWNIEGMQDLVKGEGLKIINASRVKSLGSIIEPGSDEYRARQTWQLIEDMRITGNYSNLEGEAGGRHIESTYMENGELRIKVLGSNNEIVDSGRGYNLEDPLDRLALGNMIIGKKDVGTQSRFNTFSRAQEANRLKSSPGPSEGDGGVKILPPLKRATNWGAVVSNEEDRKAISSDLRKIADASTMGFARTENNPTGLLTKRDEELIDKNGKVHWSIVMTDEFKEKFPNYPYEAYNQDDESILAGIPRGVKNDIVKELNITDVTGKANVYNNNITLEQLNTLKNKLDNTPVPKLHKDYKKYIHLKTYVMLNLKIQEKLNSLQIPGAGNQPPTNTPTPTGTPTQPTPTQPTPTQPTPTQPTPTQPTPPPNIPSRGDQSHIPNQGINWKRDGTGIPTEQRVETYDFDVFVPKPTGKEPSNYKKAKEEKDSKDWFANVIVPTKWYKGPLRTYAEMTDEGGKKTKLGAVSWKDITKIGLITDMKEDPSLKYADNNRGINKNYPDISYDQFVNEKLSFIDGKQVLTIYDEWGRILEILRQQ